MAAYQDLIDAIAHVRACTGDPDGWMRGLSGADLAVAGGPVGVVAPAALDAVLGKIRAAHPGLFDPRTGAPVVPLAVPAAGRPDGAAAQAIGEAEIALAQQHSAVAQLDLQVVAAVLTAHTTHADGRAALDGLQHDIENAVLTRPDLDTPAGARSFQCYLLGKVRDIRSVVETVDLDAGSKAVLAAALASLYASPRAEEESAPPPPESRAAAPRADSSAEPLAVRDAQPDFGADPPFDDALFGADPLSEAALSDQLWGRDLPPPAGAAMSAPPAQPAAVMPPIPALSPGGGTPSPSPAVPFGSGLPLPAGPAFPGSAGTVDRPAVDELAVPFEPDLDPRQPAEPEDAPEDGSEDKPEEDPATTVRLPGGETVTAANQALARAITAAVEGTPIPEAFRQQGITISPPGSPVAQPVDPSRLAAGDIGVLADRHALALGNGKALLDGRIQPVTSVTGPEFLGWEHPPAPAAAAPSTKSGAPTPTRPAVTAGPSG